MKSIKIELSIDELEIIMRCLIGIPVSRDKEKETAELYDRLNKITAGI